MIKFANYNNGTYHDLIINLSKISSLIDKLGKKPAQSPYLNPNQMYIKQSRTWLLLKLTQILIYKDSRLTKINIFFLIFFNFPKSDKVNCSHMKLFELIWDQSFNQRLAPVV